MKKYRTLTQAYYPYAKIGLSVVTILLACLCTLIYSLRRLMDLLARRIEVLASKPSTKYVY